MSTPTLAPIASAHANGVQLFVVRREGEFGGQSYEAGQVVVCRGTPRCGEVVVLVALGHGRPRLGRVEGLGFTGDAGEPRDPARWVAAGKVVAAIRKRPQGWVVELSSSAAPTWAGEAWEAVARAPAVADRAVVDGALETPSVAQPRADAQQLSLFAA